MPVQLYDTLSRTTKQLASESDHPFLFYCCGPTVYGPAHIGNFRTFLIQDVLRRTLEADGIRVQHVRNITDVDDKTIRSAIAAKLTLKEFTAQWIDKFRTDCKMLNMCPPQSEPSAIDHIPQQIELIESLLEKGHAYVAEDSSVYFRVQSFNDYGLLSHLKNRTLKTQNKTSSGERNDADEYDREAICDFALWKKRKPEDGENYWKSPWGEGRPGWHLECSAMIHSTFKGASIDLHGGGIDLCFPHHENELAQSECAYEKTFCKHWFHSAHLMVEGEKMSKSLGNLYTLDNLHAKNIHPMVVRYLLIAGSYRQQLNFTFDGLHAAQSALQRIERFAESLLIITGESKDAMDNYIHPSITNDFGRLIKAWDALCNNLNTPACLGALFEVIGSNPATSLDSAGAHELLQSLGKLLYALGLNLFVHEKKTVDAPTEIIALARKRWDAKQAKDWDEADTLRNTLLAKGWQVSDTKDGFDLSPK